MSEGSNSFTSKYISVNKKQGIALASSFGGWLMDSMDLTIVLIVFSLVGPVLFYKGLSPAGIAFMTTMTYAVTILARPLGSAIFGHMADKVGRRDPLLYTVIGYSLTTLVLGLVPTAAAVGADVAIAIVFIIRFIAGIFVGGEYAAGYPLGMEFLEKEKRGFWSGLLQSGYPWGYLLGAAIALAYELGFGYPSAAYLALGWRLTFITAGIIPLVVFLPLRLKLMESPLFKELEAAGKKERSPFRALLTKRENLLPFLQVFVFSIGLFIGYLMILGELPSVLINVYKVPGPVATTALMLNTALGGILYVLFSTISQFIGRKVTGIILGIIAIIVDLALYPLLGGFVNNYAALYLTAMWLALGYTYWGIVPAYLSERFRTSVRATGVGFGYSSGIFVGGFYPFLVAGAMALTHSFLWSVIMWGVIGSALVAIGLAIGPETKDVDLAKHV
jgi:MFS family permease